MNNPSSRTAIFFIESKNTITFISTELGFIAENYLGFLVPSEMNLIPATIADVDKIWEIIQFAIESRRKDGSQQWQDGYPNKATIAHDIANGHGYVLKIDEDIACYCAIQLNNEPAYDAIEGSWLSNGDFLVIHRVAVAEKSKGKGMAKKLFLLLEEHAKQNKVYSIKVDTNFDNAPMLNILNQIGYTYCGEVYFRGAPRKAFEKVLNQDIASL